ncbi:hypothetical protein J2X36_000929 [Methylobacterium sp. BE186]|uniref:DUF1489 family protein n=1 Tax=Methylobacterium sp. BE186 TaxID=2817715 RepID=UPI00286326BF|nr:DUF1489 domain-containing protein [Methylobacterium sp. BE186]MDR7036191.1 hypothetical protein [Methylobacterium sp. BE186]
MPLHLIKLCVGPRSIEDLVDRQERHRGEALRTGADPAPFHTTRMIPKRHGEIVGSGSIYWVIKGTLSCRQGITAIEPFTGTDGIARCRLVFDPKLVPVSPRSYRPFQGWRYLTAKDAPSDLDAASAGDLAEMPETLRRELVSLGLL